MLSTIFLTETLPKLAAREGQLRELLSKKEVLTDFDKTKLEKLSEKIKIDYARADEWSSQKEMLSKSLWRSVYAHQRRLHQEVEKISPALIKQVESTLPVQPSLLSSAALGNIPSAASLTGLPTILANLKSPSVEREAVTPTTSGVKRKYGSSSHLARESPSLTIKQGRQSSSDRMASPLHSSSLSVATNAFVPPSSHSHVSKKSLKNSGLSSMLAKVDSNVDLDADADADADGDADGGGDGEKDNKIYCHCQRVSFGEVSVFVGNAQVLFAHFFNPFFSPSYYYLR
jgi:chromatin modification-related protein YNG2